MPQGKGTYGSQVGRPPEKSSGFKMKRGANPNFFDLGSSKPQPGDSPLEKFSGSGAASGVAQGAKLGSMFGPWGTAIGAVAGGIFGGISGGKEEEAQAQAMKEEEKNRIVAEKLAKDKKRESLGYSGFEAETESEETLQTT